ncbi:MAG: hypothetical protein KDK03_16060 [Rhodobacteraceae bacterium]|nr:hypothetical protein [Paracoccaceae bacterium]
MRHALPLGLALMIGAAPAFGAEGGAIRSGEHGGFSRLVMQVEPQTEWSLETGPGRAVVTFPGKPLTFTTAGVFDKIPRTRITSVRSEITPAGTRITVELDCECRVSTSFVGAQYLALDIADRDAAPAEVTPTQAEAEDPAAREARESALVYNAEENLLRQIERAAEQGLVTLPPAKDAPAETAEGPPPTSLSEAYPEFAETTPPALPDAPEESEPPALPLAMPPQPRSGDGLEGLFASDQIQATTVFDRYSARATDRLTQPVLPPDCVPDYRLDIGYWSTTKPLFDQVPELRQRLYGEFDQVNPVAVVELAKLYIRYGFGAEAETLLTDFDVETPDKRLLIDLARVVDGRAVTPFGPLSRDTICPGRHGMWLAVAGATPAFRDADHFATVQEAFADLPPDLRMLIGPHLIGNLLDAGRPHEAQLIFDTLSRVGDPPSAELVLVTARLKAAEGEPVPAIRIMSGLVEHSAPNAIEALERMVEIALVENFAIPDRTVTDLRSAALENRRTPDEAPLRALLARALAARGNLGEAVEEIRDAKADTDADAFLDSVAVHVLASADPQRVGPATYARIILASGDLISEMPENDAAREEIASRLLELGLAKAAQSIVIPAAGRDAAGRLLLARAYLTQGDAPMVRRVLKDMDGAEAADLRARSFFIEGDFTAAQAELDAAGLDAEAASLAWPSGDWPRAGEAVTDPERASMARYMATRTGETAAPPPSEDPSALAPDQAFVEPLPQLEDPSLDAARRLLATGGKLEDFIQSLLAKD